MLDTNFEILYSIGSLSKQINVPTENRWFKCGALGGIGFIPKCPMSVGL